MPDAPEGRGPKAADDAASRQMTASKPCPICGKPAMTDRRPFCSKRCADIDLHRWLGGAYAIPVSDDTMERPEESDEPSV